MRSRTTTFSSLASPLGQVSDVDTSVTWPGVGLQSGSDFRGTNPLKINHFPSVLLLPYFSGLTLPRGQNHPHLFENRPTHTHTHTHTHVHTYIYTHPSIQEHPSCRFLPQQLGALQVTGCGMKRLWTVKAAECVFSGVVPQHLSSVIPLLGLLSRSQSILRPSLSMLLF